MCQTALDMCAGVAVYVDCAAVAMTTVYQNPAYCLQQRVLEPREPIFLDSFSIPPQPPRSPDNPLRSLRPHKDLLCPLGPQDV